MAMKYRKLGNTDVDVSVICLGSMTWGEQNTEAEGWEQLDYALDQGVNFIDTAELYATPARAETYGTSAPGRLPAKTEISTFSPVRLLDQGLIPNI